MLTFVCIGLLLPFFTIIYGAGKRKDWEYVVQSVGVTLAVCVGLFYAVKIAIQ